jgi:sugar/nucleoside kinase (ribokinase family)
MGAQTPNICIIGHFSIDKILLPTRSTPFTVLGGSAAYTAFTTKRLDANPAVISRVGEDFPEAYLWWLSQEGIDISGVTRDAEEKNTRFELEYGKNLAKRTLKITCKGSPINIKDIPANLKAKAIHIAPIANEVSYEIVKHLKGCAEILSIDPQGLTRSFDGNGNVTSNNHVDKRIFGLVNIYKSSIDEIYALTGKKRVKPAIKAVHDLGVETVIATNGAKGSVLSVEGTQYNIPVCPSKITVDPTGAGDVFIGGFLTEYLRQKESLWCAAVGAAAASTKLEGLGPTYFGTKEEIYQRAQNMYEKELKQ